MPAAFRNVMRASRLFLEGGDRTRSYAQTIGFDEEDPEQAGELVAIALGFRPTRVAQSQELAFAEREVQAFWQTRKELLMRKAYRAKFFHQDVDEYREVLEQIRQYNGEAPDGKLKITPDSLKQSFRRRLQTKKKIESGQGMTSPGVRKEMDQLYPGVRELSRIPVR